jgi:hypothetical protein
LTILLKLLASKHELGARVRRLGFAFREFPAQPLNFESGCGQLGSQGVALRFGRIERRINLGPPIAEHAALERHFYFLNRRLLSTHASK